ncbi:hypothetical protein ACFFSW_07415 [Saccharothrix longispora]|uniref:Uncharacterized protein n=1 Tax=Saccharothrix longispora TaxID=33920 RepID=A0ABU1PUV7_9PSEU|nr:hypothetical protein [Saccharothrix longispora]MDR6593669.1 hypothetical protein [Saccharothrix longispora]
MSPFALATHVTVEPVRVLFGADSTQTPFGGTADVQLLAACECGPATR